MRLYSLLLLLLLNACKEEKKPIATAQQVVDSFSTQVALQKDSSPVRLQFIEALDSLKLYDKAIDHLDTLLMKDSLNNELWQRKGNLHEYNKDTVKAIRSYENAVKLYPSAANQLYLANILAENRNPQALRICANIVSMSMGKETDANCNFIAGVFFASTGKSKKALQLFDLAINDNYTLMEAYMEKGFIYFDTKNYPEALKVFETTTTINNQYADAYYWKAKCNEATGKMADALLNYKRSLALDKEQKAAAAAIIRLETKK